MCKMHIRQIAAGQSYTISHNKRKCYCNRRTISGKCTEASDKGSGSKGQPGMQALEAHDKGGDSHEQVRINIPVR